MARRPAGEINAGSMADIAFLTLCFFLMTSQMDQDYGLARRLPPMPDDEQEEIDIKVNRRNIITVYISSSDRILAQNQLIDISQLKDKIKLSLLNEAEDPELPEKEITEVANFGPYPVTKGIVSLQNDRSTSYDIYLRAQNELVKAYNELRDEFSMQHYGRPFLKLDETQQTVVRTVWNQSISEAEPKDLGRKR